MPTIRSLGSQLVAKNSPGAASREKIEGRVLKPEIPGKGIPGSLERGLVEEPFVKNLPAGTERILTPSPGAQVESQAFPYDMPEWMAAQIAAEEAARQAALLEGQVGQPSGGQPSESRPGADNQALFQGQSRSVSSPSNFAPKSNAPISQGAKTSVKASAPAASSGAKPSAAQLGATAAIGGVTPKGQSSISSALRSVTQAAKSALPAIGGAIANIGSTALRSASIPAVLAGFPLKIQSP